MTDSKVYMFPELNSNNEALTAAMLNNSNSIWLNPFVYLVWMMFAGRFFGNDYGINRNGLQDSEILNQLSAIREQMNTNLNSNLIMDGIKGNSVAINQLASNLNCDFNTINSAICGVKSAVGNVAGQVGFNAERVINAISSGDAGLSRQLSECCCNIRNAITTQGYENQLAICNQTNTLQLSINNLANGLERGFSSIGYATQQLTCDITKAIGESTAAILAGLKAAEMREMQREIQALRDEKQSYQMSALLQQQSLNLVNQIKPCPIPAYLTCNPYCGDTGCNC